MSGPLSVPLAIAAIFVSGDALKIGLGITSFVCVCVAAYALWSRERLARNAAENRLAGSRIQILFDDTDDRYVRPIQTLHGQTGERYFVGIHNPGSATLYTVTLRAQESWFVDNTIAIAHARTPMRRDREPLIAELPHIDPGATELIELFGKDYHNVSAPNVFSDKRSFSLEARARDTPTVVAEFEYDPTRRPMIRQLAPVTTDEQI
jgi:hypothetical protein